LTTREFLFNSIKIEKEPIIVRLSVDMLDQEVIISYAEARSLLGRAVDKAAAMKQAGAFIVVDASGAPVNAVRMDGCPPGALPLIRAKAFAAAVNGEPSAKFAARMAKFGGGVFATYQAVMRDQPFPGAGGMPIQRNGLQIGAIATGLGIGPFIKLPGVDRSQFLVNGQPANLEDLIISYALGVPYNAQHGDDMQRWVEAYGSPPDAEEIGTGLAPVPAASGQPRLGRAQKLAEFMVAQVSVETPVSVAIVDSLGDVICLDRMDGAAPMGVDAATAIAVAAVNFGMSSADIVAAQPDAAMLNRLLDLVPYRMLPRPGGEPVRIGGRIIGAVGVHGLDISFAQNLARQGADWAATHFGGKAR
jgi:uncharacterized protein GlcG (DUF336 family)